jgi:putative sigma-54 modulation protein
MTTAFSLRFKGIDDTAELHQDIERRLRFCLARFAGEVRRVNVWVQDTNGPRGGVDKQVRVEVRGTRFEPIVIEENDTDVWPAVERATDRLGRGLARAVERANNKDRGTIRGKPLLVSVP